MIKKTEYDRETKHRLLIQIAFFLDEKSNKKLKKV